MLPEHVKLFKEFGQRVCHTEFNLDETAIDLLITIEGKSFRLFPSDNNKAIYCYRQLCVLPTEPERELALLRYISEENCFFKSTGIGILGTRSGLVFYSARIPAQGATARDLENLVEACFNLCNVFEKGCEAALSEAEVFSKEEEKPNANAIFV